MANDFIKAEKVVATLLGALQRELVLGSVVWVDPAVDFTGAKGDAVTIRIPAVTSARSRGLRSGATRTRDSLNEGKVVVTLDNNLYKDIEITDAEMTLDIENFARQVLAPIALAMAEGYEDAIADLMGGATYANSVAWSAVDPHGVLVDAGVALDNARVPASSRVAVLGTNLAADVVKSDQARRYDSAGDSASAALRDATVDRFGGFRIVKSTAIDPDMGYAFHRTAYALTSKVPVKPDGVAWGTTMAHNGFAMRAIRQFDPSPDEWKDILGFDAFVGADVVQDHGTVTGGVFTPAEDPDNDTNTDLVFVRAVEIDGTP
ncbi:MAG: hypothetical protein ACK5O2_00620 [Microthrixaceae bacterium]